jgi:predicted nucleotidyltransferase
MVVKNIEIPQDKIVNFCQHWKITEFALFGSVLRHDFHSDSDIDVLATFATRCLMEFILTIFAVKLFLALLKLFMLPRDLSSVADILLAPRLVQMFIE